MNRPLPVQNPSRARYGVLGFACALAMITYLDRVCFGTVAPYVQGEFGLSDSQLGWLFTSFALAYAVFEVPTGWLGDVFGPRVTLVRIVLWWSAFTALTGLIFPIAGYPALAFWALLTVRFLFGIGEAGAFPNISCAFARWFPFTERGRAQGAVWMAGRFGGGITPFVVSSLVFVTFDGEGGAVTNWRHIFWIFGGLGVLWCVVFWWWFRDGPEQHPAVNAAELALIRGGTHAAHDGHSPPDLDLGHQLDAGKSPRVLTGQSEAVKPAEFGIAQSKSGEFSAAIGNAGTSASAAPAHAGHSPRNVPWGHLLTDLNLWTLCLMYFGCAYGWYFNITWLPKYLKSQYAVTRDSHGFWTYSLMSGLPLLLGSLACLAGGVLTDAFIRRTGNRKWGRRLFGVVGHGVCAACYFLSLTADSPWLFVFYVAMAAFWNDLTMGSAWASCIDVGGKYAGIVSGCMNTIGNLGGAVAGISTGAILDHYGTQTGWTINFVSFGMVYVAAVLLWLNFDATKQVPQR